jgi:hypothetical protein
MALSALTPTLSEMERELRRIPLFFWAGYRKQGALRVSCIGLGEVGLDHSRAGILPVQMSQDTITGQAAIVDSWSNDCDRTGVVRDSRNTQNELYEMAANSGRRHCTSKTILSRHNHICRGTLGSDLVLAFDGPARCRSIYWTNHHTTMSHKGNMRSSGRGLHQGCHGYRCFSRMRLSHSFDLTLV